jgi:hypothetical protein
LTGNSAGLRTVVSSGLSNTELCSSLRESHSFLSLPADTTVTPSLGIQNQHPSLAIHSADDHRMIYSFSNTTILHILRFLFLFLDNIMADLASKQQTTALFLSTTVTSTRRRTELTQKNPTNMMGNL